MLTHKVLSLLVVLYSSLYAEMTRQDHLHLPPSGQELERERVCALEREKGMGGAGGYSITYHSDGCESATASHCCNGEPRLHQRLTTTANKEL